MKNIELDIDDDVLTITIQLAERNGKSKSGKTTTVATTSGNVVLDGYPNLFLGLNLYEKD